MVAAVIARVAAGPIDTRPPTTVASIDELVSLSRVSVMSLSSEPPLVLALAHPTGPEARLWEARLNREWTSCGCRAGEIAVMVSIAGYASVAAAGFAPDVSSMWGHAGWAAVVALAAAAAGKIAGRARSLRRFRRVVRKMAALTSISN